MAADLYSDDLASTKEVAQELLHSVRDAQTVKDLFKAMNQINMYLFVKGNDQLLMEAGAPPIVAAALETWDDLNIKLSCAELIAALSRKNGEDAEAFANEGVLEMLVPLASETTRGHYHNATYALYEMTKTSIQAAQRLRCVPNIIDILSELDDPTDYTNKVLNRLRPLSETGRFTKPARA